MFGDDVEVSIAAAGDTALSNPQNSQVLTYNSSTSKWVNATPTGGSGGTSLGANWINVKDYGAVGNGSTDDTSAINSAITAAGIGGTVFFPRSSGAYMISSPLCPLERQLWAGTHSPMYDWDDTPPVNCALKATSGFSGAALVYMSNTSVGRGATFRNLMFIGRGDTTGSLNGLDLGAVTGGERAWMIDKCQFMHFSGAAIAGYMWVVDIRDTHISRCGYGIRPTSGAAGSACRANDNRWIGNQIYFTYHHAIALDGTVESGAITIVSNRIERAGVQMVPYNPNYNRDETACGIYISRATSVQLIGNFTDANASHGLNLDPAGHGEVNNVTSLGNIWKRDGTGNNVDSMCAGVRVYNTVFCTFRGDRVTYGDPDDGDAYSYPASTRRIAPQYGVEIDSNEWFDWDGTVQLPSNSLIRSNGYRWLTTTQSNWMCSVRDPRQPVLMIPHATLANAPANPQEGAVFYNTDANTLCFYNGSAWRNVTGTAA